MISSDRCMQLEQELEQINKEIEIAVSKITDEDFIRNPMKRMHDLTKLLESTKNQMEEITDKIGKVQTSYSNLIEQQKSNPLTPDHFSESIKRLEAEKNTYKNENERLKKEYMKQSDDYDTLKNNEHEVYVKLYAKRFKLQKELGIDQKNTETELQAIKNTLNPENTSSLAYKIRQKLNEEKEWFENLKTRHGFELSSTKSDGAAKAEFISKTGACIEIDENTVRFKGTMTTANMKEIAPTLIVLFLKSTEGSNCSCRVEADSEDVKKYLIQMLATELMKQSPNNASHVINGKTVNDILNPKTPSHQKQRIESETPVPQTEKRI